MSVREQSDSEQVQSDEADAEASPTKSPTTPKTVKCKPSSGMLNSVSDFHYKPFNLCICLSQAHKLFTLSRTGPTLPNSVAHHHLTFSQRHACTILRNCCVH